MSEVGGPVPTPGGVVVEDPEVPIILLLQETPTSRRSICWGSCLGRVCIDAEDADQCEIAGSLMNIVDPPRHGAYFGVAHGA